eukprot:3540099-Alexandrium_andersonii.AAC.1
MRPFCVSPLGRLMRTSSACPRPRRASAMALLGRLLLDPEFLSILSLDLLVPVRAMLAAALKAVLHLRSAQILDRKLLLRRYFELFVTPPPSGR